MIAQEYPALADAVAALLFALVFFVAGVAYAAYRAVSWVERMRAWASSVVLDERED